MEEESVQGLEEEAEVEGGLSSGELVEVDRGWEVVARWMWRWRRRVAAAEEEVR